MLASRKEEYLDMEKLIFPLTLRTRRPGDKMVPLGMKGRKKIKDILIDEKIPLRLRNNLPVIETGGDIAWLCGVKISDKYKITNSTSKVLRLKLLKR